MESAIAVNFIFHTDLSGYLLLLSIMEKPSNFEHAYFEVILLKLS